MKVRLGKVIVERGLAENRTKAQALILAGQVIVNQQRVDKPGQLVQPDSEIRIKRETSRYASRGGLKLESALGNFRVDPSGRHCLDVGASTGGFTDCLLQHGAAHVWAVDVGHNQIIWRLRNDPRVTVLEGLNARNLSPEMFPLKFELATIDVSFIGLAKVLPAISDCLTDVADCIALVKPQFEVGKGEVGKGGVVSDREKHRRVLNEVRKSAESSGLWAHAAIESPILGADGNREFFLHLRRSEPADSGLVDKQISELTNE